ncbi:hypothetical protein D9757_009069 [Collybiopsis confluens]|uniref:thioredoxin-dependent peroxiredoxin n=1 Tax=Collybiopsis confluens TaxID=2823264 RepID=A0A8H5M5H5_9AGAR|nr:hypothetical protein D9757_009069 [Collybiopsis confluens]
MSAEAPVTGTDVSPTEDTMMAPPAAEESAVAASEDEQVEKDDDKTAEDGAETKDKKTGAGKDKEAKAPSRRSTRISSKPQSPVEPKEPAKTKRAASTRKRASDDNEEQAKSTKKAKSDSASEAGLALGSFLPDITLKSEKEVDVEISLLAKEKGVVLFLVPKADTPGCTNQACGFRDIYSEFTTAEYEVYCVSADPPAAQSKWQDKKSLPYGLLSDPERKLISALGANDKGKTKRSHFVFAKAEDGAEGKGKLVEKKLGVKPVDSPKLALDFIKGYVPEAPATNGGTSTSIDAAEAPDTNGNAEEEEKSTETAEVNGDAPADNGTEDVAMESVSAAVA